MRTRALWAAAAISTISVLGSGMLAAAPARPTPEYVTNGHGVRMHRLLVDGPALPGEEDVSSAQARAVAARRRITPPQARRLLAFELHANRLIDEARLIAPTSLGGGWLNENILGTVTLSVVGQPGDVIDVLRSRFSWPDTVRVSRATNSADKLARISNEVWRARGAWARQLGYQWSMVDERNDRVVVGVSLDAASAQRALDRRFGPGVTAARYSANAGSEQHIPAVNANCADATRQHCNPLRGGIEDHQVNNHGSYCTWGFGARALAGEESTRRSAVHAGGSGGPGPIPTETPTVPPTPTPPPTPGPTEGPTELPPPPPPPPPGPAPAPPLILTAGHCLALNHHSDTLVGPTQAFHDGGPVDAMSVLPLGWGVENWVWETASSRAAAITSVYRGPAIAAGTDLCVSGMTSGLLCGEVRSGNLAGREHANMLGYDMCTNPGDSGGPVYYAGQAVGIHEGTYLTYTTGPCFAWASYVSWVELMLGVVVLTN